MHLEHPKLTTTSTKKRKEKITKAKQLEFEQGWKEHNIFLKSINLPKQTFEEYLDWLHGKVVKTHRTKSAGKEATKTYTGMGKSIREKACLDETASRAKDQGHRAKEAHWVKGPTSSKPAPTYTGTKVIGIATMHKSNLVPIFTDDEAKDVASMRR